MARPNQKLVAVLSSIVELGHSPQSMQTALNAITKPATASGKPAPKTPAKKPGRKPKGPDFSFLAELADEDLVEFAAAALEMEEDRVERAVAKGRDTVYKRLLKESASIDEFEGVGRGFLRGSGRRHRR